MPLRCRARRARRALVRASCTTTQRLGDRPTFAGPDSTGLAIACKHPARFVSRCDFGQLDLYALNEGLRTVNGSIIKQVLTGDARPHFLNLSFARGAGATRAKR